MLSRSTAGGYDTILRPIACGRMRATPDDAVLEAVRLALGTAPLGNDVDPITVDVLARATELEVIDQVLAAGRILGFTGDGEAMAVAAARRVPHVRKVECDLNVASARKVHRGGIQQVQFAQQMAQETDQGNQQMAEQIAGALRAAQFRGKGVQIRFQGGVVTLIGEVADPQTKALADQTVMQIPGVQGFDNQLVAAVRIASAD